jgi:hypothetical protein
MANIISLKLCRYYYHSILTILIPFYLLLYGATSHKFKPPVGDIVSLVIIVISLIISIRFNKIRSVYLTTLSLTLFSAFYVVYQILAFEFSSMIAQAIFLTLIATFIYSNARILFSLFNKRVK